MIILNVSSNCGLIFTYLLNPSIFLNSVGIPTSGIALIMGADRILDICRTTVNIAGDLVTCKVMDRLLAKEAEEKCGDVTVQPEKNEEISGEKNEEKSA